MRLPDVKKKSNPETMQSKLTRRTFLKRAGLAAGAAPFLTFPNIGGARAPSDILNCVQVGCGGRGTTHLEQVIVVHKQNLAAIVDPDEKRHAHATGWLKGKGVDTSKTRAFTDYRVMFDKMGKQIDAVFVTTPNHHHATVALTALELGHNVYCEKPLTHTIAETRMLREKARDHNKVATQMGNQGH